MYPCKIIQKLTNFKKQIQDGTFKKEKNVKESKIGLIPKHWEIFKLKEKYIFTKKPRNLDYRSFGTIAFIPMEMIPFGKISFSNYVMKKTSEISSGTYFEDGDSLLPKITPSFENGKQGIVTKIPNGFGIATTEVIPIKEISGVSDKNFLF